MPQIFKSVMVTGHRPQELTEEQIDFSKRSLLSIGKQLKRDHSTVEAISGMALGVDTWWAQVALRLELDLAAYIPFETQKNRWSQKDQQLWTNLRARASREIVCGDSFAYKWLFVRNDRMIADSDLAIAVLDPTRTKGGTVDSVRKIRKLEKPMILVDIHNLTVTREHF